MARLMGAALVLTVLSCPEQLLAQACAPGKALAYANVERSVVGPYAAGTVTLVKSATDWNQTMELLLAGGSLAEYPIDAPHVDWKKQAIVLVALGQCPTYGYDVEITGVTRMGRKAMISVRYTAPEGGLQIQAVTSPYHMVSFDRTGISEVEICYSGPSLGLQVMANGNDDDLTPAFTRISWSELKSR
jgi:hypothetical protein